MSGCPYVFCQAWCLDLSRMMAYMILSRFRANAMMVVQCNLCSRWRDFIPITPAPTGSDPKASRGGGLGRGGTLWGGVRSVFDDETRRNPPPNNYGSRNRLVGVVPGFLDSPRGMFLLRHADERGAVSTRTCPSAIGGLGGTGQI